MPPLKQDLARAIGEFLEVTERPDWFSRGSKVTAEFQRDIGPALGIPKYGPDKVQHMRAILASVAVPWNAARHSSDETDNPGGNVTKHAYEDLLAALHSSDDADELLDGDDGRAGTLPPEFVQRSIRLRRGQSAFRDALLRAYGGACVITGSTARSVLEAAHILPYAAGGATRPSNGLLLRADVHTLFDLRLVSIDTGDWSVVMHQSLRGTEYWCLRGKAVTLPRYESAAPDRRALDQHRVLSGL